MTTQEYDIFSGAPKQNPLWLEKTEGFGAALQRMQQIARKSPVFHFLVAHATSAGAVRHQLGRTLKNDSVVVLVFAG